MKDSNATIFIVEDDSYYAELVNSVLQSNNLKKTQVFHSGEEFLDRMEEQPDVVILDYQLGKMSGIHILKEIKERYPKTIVLFLSGQDQMQIAVNALKLGAADYINKSEHSAIGKIVSIIEKKLIEAANVRNNKTRRFREWFMIS